MTMAASWAHLSPLHKTWVRIRSKEDNHSITVPKGIISNNKCSFNSQINKFWGIEINNRFEVTLGQAIYTSIINSSNSTLKVVQWSRISTSNYMWASSLWTVILETQGKWAIIRCHPRLYKGSSRIRRATDWPTRQTCTITIGRLL